MREDIRIAHVLVLVQVLVQGRALCAEGHGEQSLESSLQLPRTTDDLGGKAAYNTSNSTRNTGRQAGR
jgi:hypothetical protein